jgi:ankyrin repeat protein
MPDPLSAFPIKTLSARPSLEQYKKQAKELLRAWRVGEAEALARVKRHCPADATASLTAAQLILAREHGFPSWTKFAAEIESLRIARAVAEIDDPVAAFLSAATVPREDHDSGTLEEAEAILARYPHVAGANIYTAAVLADEAAVRRFLALDQKSATAPGAPFGWDALTYLCFSRYLRLDRERSDAFVPTARALLEAGADANTGWWETIDLDTTPRQIPERVIYGAAGIAQHAGLTRLLLEYGADPNDEETAYHVSEGYDLTTIKVLLESGRFNSQSLVTLLIRKADWHDLDGMKLALEYGADPSPMTRWGITALHHSIQRDNWIEMIQLLLDHGADPIIKNVRDFSASTLAARRGRGDVLKLLAERGIDPQLEGVDRLIAACAQADDEAIRTLLEEEPNLAAELLAEGGTLLAQFAGNGNTEGMRRLLDLGVRPDALYAGDRYFEIAQDSTALHVSAWRGRPEATKLLLEHGAPVNALDGDGRTALQLAIRACTNSYWKRGRMPEWIKPLLKDGATTDGIELPTGYAEADALLAQYTRKPS